MLTNQQDIRERFASKTISNAVFFLPFCYLFRVRLGSVGKLLSWCLLYPLLTFFYAAALNLFHFDTTFFCTFLLIFCATFSIYEIGYIFNDAFAVEREQKPALRLYPHNILFAKKWILQIVFARIAVASVCLILLRFFLPIESVLVQFACLIFIALVFAIYNRIRNKYSAFVYPFLVFSRYLPLVILYFEQPNFWQILLLLYLAFPLLNAIERFSMETHRFRFITWLIPQESAKTYVRIGYYFLTSAILSIVFRPIYLLTPFYLLLIYRSALAVIVHFKPPKRYLKG